MDCQVTDQLRLTAEIYYAVCLEDSDNPGNRGQQQTRRDTEIVKKKFQQIRAESCPEADDKLAVHCYLSTSIHVINDQCSFYNYFCERKSNFNYMSIN